MLTLLSVVASISMTAAPAPDVKMVEVPPRTPGREALVVGDDLKALGKTYYTVPSPGQPERALQLSAERSGQIIEASTSDVVGFISAGPADNPANFARGGWRVGIENMKSKDAPLTTKLKEKDLLNRKKDPYITFGLYGVADVKLVKQFTWGPTTYSGRLRGEITINGTTRDVSIDDATLMFVPANAAAAVAGDILVLRFRYDIELSDYGVEDDIKRVHITEGLVFSSIPPAAAKPVAKEMKEADRKAEDAEKKKVEEEKK